MRRFIPALLVVASIFGCRLTPGTSEGVLVEFHSDPPGADVWVDGLLAGQTPMQQVFPWPEPSHTKTATFRLEGYIPEKRTISEHSSIIEVSFQQLAEMLARQVETDPPGATLVPIEDEERPGYRVVLPGYRTREIAVDELRRGDPLKVQLTPLIPRLP